MARASTAAAAVAESASEFQEAKVRWNAASTEYRTATERVAGLEAALILARATESERTSGRLHVIEGRAERAFGKHVPTNERKLRQWLEEAREHLEEAALPKYREELQLWEKAQSRERTRVALEIQPRHKAAVQRLAKAVEAMSEAITAERECRNELALAGLMPPGGSQYLPDCSSGLLLGTLTEWNSPAQQWVRRMREIGVLK